MAAVSTPLRDAPPQGVGWLMGVAGLALLGVLMGAALVIGEVQAFWIGLSFLAGCAVLYDFRIGAVLLILMLPIANSTVFPRSLFGIVGLTPLNMMIFATLASFLVRALDTPLTEVDFFDDDDGAPHEDAINSLAAAGVVTGCAERVYCHTGTVTREQMAAFLYRAFGPAD